MSFSSILKQSNSSLSLSDKMILECFVQKKTENRIFLDIGLKAISVCLQKELQTYRRLSELLLQCARLGFNLYKSNNFDNISKVDSDLGTVSEASFLLKSKKRQTNRFINSSGSNLNKLDLLLGKKLNKIKQKIRSAKLVQNNFQNLDKISLPKGVISYGALNDSSNTYTEQTKFDFLSLALINKNLSLTSSYVRLQSVNNGSEPKLQLPNKLARNVERQFIWLLLHELLMRRQKYQNIVFGRIVRSLKGGYAVAIPGYIAFLPKSLSQKQFRLGGLFSILKMNVEKRNIVVKQLFVCKSTVKYALSSPLNSYRWLYPYPVKTQNHVYGVEHSKKRLEYRRMFKMSHKQINAPTFSNAML